ncbi:hypothetical protein F4803DRAFT_522943 [Xylaria telfairii]|nr:hypothetical protein F4803DRAFT_522943 [Xylaria telfairii]
MAEFLIDNITVGGRGGYEFNSYKFQSGILLKRFGAWSNGDGIQGIRLSWTDGTSDEYGSRRGDWHEITFQGGERCRELVLWGNGIGTRCGRIKIVTETKNFEAGKDVSGQDSYPMDVGEGLLVGFRGRHGSEIDALGACFLDDIASMRSEVTYTNQPSGGIVPIELDSQTFGPGPESGMDYKFEGSTKRTTSNTWTQDSSTIFGVEMKISAGIPEIISGDAGFSWTMTESEQHSKTESEERELTWGISGHLKPGDSVRYIALCREGRATLDYKSTVVVTLKNGRTFLFPEKGTLDSVALSDTQVKPVPV